MNQIVVEALKVARPRHLREALGIAFVYRGKFRWHGGHSGFLGIDVTAGNDNGVVIDVADVADFHEIRSDANGLTIGAFADIAHVAREPLIRTALGSAPLAPQIARFRLAALEAQVVIAGTGTTRTVPLAALATTTLPANEIPLAVTLAARLPKVAFGDRRIQRRDGAATFELRVFVALALTGVHRVAHANVTYVLDDGPPLPLPGVIAALTGVLIAKGTFSDAARAGADAFHGDDEKTSVIRRTIIPLVLSALKDAYDSSRAGEAPPAQRRVRPGSSR